MLIIAISASAQGYKASVGFNAGSFFDWKAAIGVRYVF